MAAFDVQPLDLKDSNATEDIFILSEVAALMEEGIQHRRYFHAYPELSFEEVETAKKLKEILLSYGITEIYEQVGRTGLVVLIRGEAGPGPCIALRADMDALPIQETADIPYCSKNANAMHACGHDGHMTGLLLAAKILNQTKASLKGKHGMSSVATFTSFCLTLLNFASVWLLVFL